MKTTARRLLTRTLALFLAIAGLTACGKDTGRSTETDSAGFTTLDEKKQFLERYVTFRRPYEELDFDISYTDGGEGRMPGPSEWDIRIAAKVPADQIDDWTAGLEAAEAVDTGWLRDIPKAPGALEGFEWFAKGGQTVGVDRKQRIVVYRNRVL